MSRRVAVLGSTGSIGSQALEVIEKSSELELYSIVCGSSVEKLKEQTDRYSPVFSSCTSSGEEDGILLKAIDGADMVLNAIVGSAGLKASLIAQEMDIPLALANKESLVVGSDLLEKHLSSALVIPVDSEHSTIFRCLQGETRKVRRITLTASGGSLRDTEKGDIYNASPEMVLAHPTWDMGGRITVDSASMVNKAFEVLEARALFPGIPVDAVIHRSSVVHSFIESADGAWKALLGLPDMKIPIAWALLYPELPTYAVSNDNPLDWGDLSFQAMEEQRYPAFFSVLSAGDTGGTAPTAANAADEIAVKAFLQRRLPFGAISAVIDEVLASTQAVPVEDFAHILSVDSTARRNARKAVDRICSL
ncbi:MAG: 1-deoxy-D-xylulose-5-phosphate reductoisomerase [Candidatus Sabulitectum sp.]|nr:1-deoxy-D-xylulose-5-phosphate reductoisomerase [Candidatus Sabulitectum sp.]